MSRLMSATILSDGTVGCAAKYLRPEQPLLLGGHGHEHDRPLRLGAGLLQQPRDLDHRRDAGRIVHRAVVDAVAVDGAADADVIEVRGHHHVFGLQRRVGSLEDADDVRGLDRLALHCRVRAQRAGSGNRGSGLLSATSCFDLVDRVAAAGEELLGAARVIVSDTIWPACPAARVGQRRSPAGAAGAPPRPAAPAPRRARRRGVRRGPAGGRGLGCVATPIAPAFFSAAHRSSAELTCDFTLSGHLHGASASRRRRFCREVQPGQIVPASLRESTARSRRTPSALRSGRRVRRARSEPPGRAAALPCRCAPARASTDPERVSR